jgi:hypothetical protein
MATFFEQLKAELKEAFLGALIPARREYSVEEQWARYYRDQARFQREQRQHYEQQAEDARMRYLMNPGSQQAPPGDYYRR